MTKLQKIGIIIKTSFKGVFMNHFCKNVSVLALAALSSIPAFSDTHSVKLFSTVTDAGQVVDRIEIDFGKGAQIKGADAGLLE